MTEIWADCFGELSSRSLWLPHDLKWQLEDLPTLGGVNGLTSTLRFRNPTHDIQLGPTVGLEKDAGTRSFYRGWGILIAEARQPMFKSVGGGARGEAKRASIGGTGCDMPPIETWCSQTADSGMAPTPRRNL